MRDTPKKSVNLYKSKGERNTKNIQNMPVTSEEP